MPMDPLSYADMLKTIKANFECLKAIIPQEKTFKEVLETEILADTFPKSDLPNIKTKDVL